MARVDDALTRGAKPPVEEVFIYNCFKKQSSGDQPGSGSIKRWVEPLQQTLALASAVSAFGTDCKKINDAMTSVTEGEDIWKMLRVMRVYLLYYKFGDVVPAKSIPDIMNLASYMAYAGDDKDTFADVFVKQNGVDSVRKLIGKYAPILQAARGVTIKNLLETLAAHSMSILSVVESLQDLCDTDDQLVNDELNTITWRPIVCALAPRLNKDLDDMNAATVEISESFGVFATTFGISTVPSEKGAVESFKEGIFGSLFDVLSKLQIAVQKELDIQEKQARVLEREQRAAKKLELEQLKTKGGAVVSQLKRGTLKKGTEGQQQEEDEAFKLQRKLTSKSKDEDTALEQNRENVPQTGPSSSTQPAFPSLSPVDKYLQKHIDGADGLDGAEQRARRNLGLSALKEIAESKKASEKDKSPVKGSSKVELDKAKRDLENSGLLGMIANRQRKVFNTEETTKLVKKTLNSITDRLSGQENLQLRKRVYAIRNFVRENKSPVKKDRLRFTVELNNDIDSLDVLLKEMDELDDMSSLEQLIVRAESMMEAISKVVDRSEAVKTSLENSKRDLGNLLGIANSSDELKDMHSEAGQLLKNVEAFHYSGDLDGAEQTLLTVSYLIAKLELAKGEKAAKRAAEERKRNAPPPDSAAAAILALRKKVGSTDSDDSDSDSDDSDPDVKAALQYYHLNIEIGAGAPGASTSSTPIDNEFYDAVCKRIHESVTSSLVDAGRINRELLLSYAPSSCIAAVAAVAKRAVS